MQHADPQHLDNSDGYNADSTSSYGNSVYYTSVSSGYGTAYDTKERDGDTCIELPFANNVPGLTAGNRDLVNGIYTDGGQLRAFDGATYLGFYIVRKDSKIYIPWVINKGAAGIAGFGDTVLSSTRTVSSVHRRLQISVSPDGRFASARLKPSVDNFVETSGTEQILIFSLTGEKFFTGSATFRQLSTGGTGGSADGTYFYGDSMSLTNTNLYFLKGNNVGRGGGLNSNIGTDTVIYSGHFVYKVAIAGGTNAPNPALLSPGFGGVGGWTNNSNQPLSTAFHRWCPPASSSLNSPTNNWVPSPGAAPTDYTQTGAPSYMAADVQAYSFANFTADSAAPMPFRVSADGGSIAIVAADGINAATRADTQNTTNFLNRSIYVDFNNIFREAGVVKRRFSGGTRTAGARPGEYINKLYGWYQGPSTQLEISDNGTIVADVYNASVASWNNIGQSGPALSREDLSVIRGTGAITDPWTAKSETIVSTFFTNDIWRFGCLHFTRDATSSSSGVAGALWYWAGAGLYFPNNAGDPYTRLSLMSGSVYQYTISTATSINALPFAAGGHSSGVFTVTSGGPTSTIPGNWTSTLGSIMPDGYFISNDGRFLYMECLSPLMDNATTASGSPISGNDSTAGRLIAMPVLDTSTVINGNAANRAFALTGWPIDPVSHGFGSMGVQTSTWYANALWAWCGGASNRHAQQTAVTAPDPTNGTVFFNGYLQNNSWTSTNDTTTAWQGGGPTNNVAWADGAQFAGEVYAFSSNVAGPVQNLTGFGGTAGGSTIRMITYMQPNRLGTKVALQTTRSSSSSFAYRYSNFEQIYAVANVNFTATGALSTVPTRFTVEGSDGRAGPSMTWDFSDSKLYYAFIAGGANENSMQLREATVNSAGTAVSGYRTQATGFNGSSARFAVLNSSR
jgi:hypothetical protein